MWGRLEGLAGLQLSTADRGLRRVCYIYFQGSPLGFFTFRLPPPLLIASMNRFPAPISKFPPMHNTMHTDFFRLVWIYWSISTISVVFRFNLSNFQSFHILLNYPIFWSSPADENRKRAKSALIIVDFATNNWTKPKNVCEFGWNSSKMLIAEFNSKFVSNQTRIYIAVKQHFVCAHKFCWTEQCSPLVHYLYPHSLKWSLFTKLVFDANKFLSSASEFEKQIDETWNSFDWKIATT